MKYVAVALISFAAGMELGLSKLQSSARMHLLTPIARRKGWFVTTGPMQLKIGEEFYCDSEIPKNLANSLEPMEKPKQEPEQKTKTDADANTQSGQNGQAAQTGLNGDGNDDGSGDGSKANTNVEGKAD